MARPFLFPNPDNTSINDPHHFCEREKVIALYNQEHDTNRLRMSPEIEQWFEQTARSMNWIDCRFSSAGCNLTSSLIHEREAKAQREQSGNVVSLDHEARKLGR